MKILNIVVIEKMDIKPESHHIMMKDITRDDLNVEIPEGAFIVHGYNYPSEADAFAHLKKSFKKYSGFCKFYEKK